MSDKPKPKKTLSDKQKANLQKGREALIKHRAEGPKKRIKVVTHPEQEPIVKPKVKQVRIAKPVVTEEIIASPENVNETVKIRVKKALPKKEEIVPKNKEKIPKNGKQKGNGKSAMKSLKPVIPVTPELSATITKTGVKKPRAKRTKVVDTVLKFDDSYEEVKIMPSRNIPWGYH